MKQEIEDGQTQRKHGRSKIHIWLRQQTPTRGQNLEHNHTSSSTASHVAAHYRVREPQFWNHYFTIVQRRLNVTIDTASVRHSTEDSLLAFPFKCQTIFCGPVGICLWIFCRKNNTHWLYKTSAGIGTKDPPEIRTNRPHCHSYRHGYFLRCFHIIFPHDKYITSYKIQNSLM